MGNPGSAAVIAAPWQDLGLIVICPEYEKTNLLKTIIYFIQNPCCWVQNHKKWKQCSSGWKVNDKKMTRMQTFWRLFEAEHYDGAAHLGRIWIPFITIFSGDVLLFLSNHLLKCLTFFQPFYQPLWLGTSWENGTRAFQDLSRH